MRFMNSVAKEQREVPKNLAATPSSEFGSNKDPWVLQREVERMEKRMERLGFGNGTAKLAEELDSVEASIARGDKYDATLLNEIGKTRSKLCEERGFKTHQTKTCERFMRQACGLPMTKKSPLVLASRPRAKPKAKTLVLPADCGKFFIIRRNETAQPGGAPAAAAPAGAPGPAGPAILGGKIRRELPEQGYNELSSPEHVMHQDKVTMVGDWQTEFSASTGHKSFQTICAKYPDNEWCRIHGFSKLKRKSPIYSGAPRAVHTAGALLAAVTAAIFAALGL